MGHGRRSDQTQVLVEAWVPACAGMAKKGNSRIVTMLIEANWVTASFAGMTRQTCAYLLLSRAERISIEVFGQRDADRLRQHRHMPVIRMIETGDHLRAGGFEADDLVFREWKSEELDG